MSALCVGSGFGEHPPPPFVPAAFLLFSFSSSSCQFQLNGRRVHHPIHPSFAISLTLSSLFLSLCFSSISVYVDAKAKRDTHRPRWRSLAFFRSLTSIIRFRCNFQKRGRREKGSKNWFEIFFHFLRYVRFAKIVSTSRSFSRNFSQEIGSVEGIPCQSYD